MTPKLHRPSPDDSDLDANVANAARQLKANIDKAGDHRPSRAELSNHAELIFSVLDAKFNAAKLGDSCGYNEAHAFFKGLSPISQNKMMQLLADFRTQKNG